MIIAGISAILAGPTRADPVLDRALSDVAIREERGCAIIRIAFNFRIRYVSHFPLGHGSELRITLEPIDRATAAAQVLVRRESLRAPRNARAAIRGIEFETGKAQGSTLTVYFEHSVAYNVSQGSDFTSLIVAISGRKPSSTCRATFPARSNGSWGTIVPSGGTTVPSGGTAVPPVAIARKAIRTRNARSKAEPGRSASAKKLKSLMAKSRKALTAKNHRRAIGLLTKILSYPKHKYSREAQELLGLARQRNGQLAHARAEYEEYLHRYPSGPGAKRVRQRLAALVTARKAPKGKLRKARRRGRRRSEDGNHFDMSGSVSQFYFRDENFRRFRDPSLPPERTKKDDKDHNINQNEILTSLDVIARWGNGNVNSKLRFSGTEARDFRDKNPSNFRNNDPKDEMTVSTLYLETAIREWDLNARLGRQSRNTGGLLGRFDGALLSWQVSEYFRLDGVVGAPVESRRDMPLKNDALVYGVSAGIGPVVGPFDTTLYYVEQRADSLLDRQAIGTELRYSAPGRSAFALLDYDVHFGKLNTAYATGSWTLTDKSTFNLTIDYRNSPILLTSNALQGQSFSSLDAMRAAFSLDDIRQIARDRTTKSKSATLGFSRPITEKLQVNADVTIMNMSASPASAGVPEMPSTGNEYYYSAQLIGTNILTEGDVFVAGLRYADRQNSDVTVFDLHSRYPLSRKLRVTPRIRLSWRDDTRNNLTEFTVLPSIRLDYRLRRRWHLEFETGARWSDRKQTTISENNLEYFFIAGYRYDFDLGGR